jgi:N,N'-diacetyllegionaminate synthase
MSNFTIGPRDVSRGDVPFIVEEGQANEGRLPVALEMIRAAAASGADGIEFQLAVADDFYVRSHRGHAIYKSREFTPDQLRTLVQAATDAQIAFVAAVFSPHLVPVLRDAGCAAFNVNASDLTNHEIMDAVAASGRPFFLSLPLATREEIDWAVERVRRTAAAPFALLLGQHTMKTGEGGVPVEATCLGAIATLRERYSVPVGFIDHTNRTWMPAVAVAAGAAAITKHMALRRADHGSDWQICLEPDEMAEAVRMVRAVGASIAESDKVVAEGELLDRRFMRRSIVASEPVSVGQPIRREQLAFKRPGLGIDPRFVDQIVGAIAKRPFAPDESLEWDALEPRKES